MDKGLVQTGIDLLNDIFSLLSTEVRQEIVIHAFQLWGCLPQGLRLWLHLDVRQWSGNGAGVLCRKVVICIKITYVFCHWLPFAVSRTTSQSGS